VQHFERVGYSAVARKKFSAIRKLIGRHVENTHHQCARAKLKLTSAQAPCITRSLHPRDCIISVHSHAASFSKSSLGARSFPVAPGFRARGQKACPQKEFA